MPPEKDRPADDEDFHAMFLSASTQSGRPKSAATGGIGEACASTSHLGNKDVRRGRRDRGLEVQFQRLPKILYRFIFALTLARHIDLKALDDIPIAFPPDAYCECLLHFSPLSPQSFLHS
jgi:hypothetical protein